MKKRPRGVAYGNKKPRAEAGRSNSFCLLPFLFVHQLVMRFEPVADLPSAVRVSLRVGARHLMASVLECSDGGGSAAAVLDLRGANDFVSHKVLPPQSP